MLIDYVLGGGVTVLLLAYLIYCAAPSRAFLTDHFHDCES